VDLSCIILSGDLELYVMGMLPPDEAAKMEQLIALFPEIREDADRISMALEAAANQSSLAPGASVKQKLFSQLKDLKENEIKGVPDTHEYAQKEPDVQKFPPTRKVVPMKKDNRQWMMAASLAGLVIITGLAIYLYTQTQQQNNEMVRMQNNLDSANYTMQQLQQENMASGQLLRIMQDENFKPVTLQAVPGKPEATVQVYWNTQTSEVFLVDISLPPPPSGKQYQFWAIVDGQPVDGGLLDNVKQYAQKMTSFPKATAFAITLENTGGSPVPTLDQMFVIGQPS
jgi:anti-sigma-K factor RskA